MSIQDITVLAQEQPELAIEGMRRLSFERKCKNQELSRGAASAPPLVQCRSVEEGKYDNGINDRKRNNASNCSKNPTSARVTAR
jgi:hypothetical protein